MCYFIAYNLELSSALKLRDFKFKKGFKLTPTPDHRLPWWTTRAETIWPRLSPALVPWAVHASKWPVDMASMSGPLRIRRRWPTPCLLKRAKNCTKLWRQMRTTEKRRLNRGIWDSFPTKCECPQPRMTTRKKTHNVVDRTQPIINAGL